MRHVLWGLAAIALIVYAMTVTGCATDGTPTVVVKTVTTPVPIPCPDKRGPEPKYGDSAAELQALPTTVERVKRLLEANVLLHQRVAEDGAQIAACSSP